MKLPLSYYKVINGELYVECFIKKEINLHRDLLNTAINTIVFLSNRDIENISYDFKLEHIETGLYKRKNRSKRIEALDSENDLDIPIIPHHIVEELFLSKQTALKRAYLKVCKETFKVETNENNEVTGFITKYTIRK